ncbi:hypothetical protein [Parahaliea mediterranea]|uniref:hypothetical protein n=1 Tax=Parahaliea mediterranea TaxID=651086 RepID=UPI000E2F35CD|nr:hypothetical protein [Parahaliea mediterranea]
MSNQADEVEDFVRACRVADSADGKRSEAAQLLRFAAGLIENDPEMDGGASWRIVDALVILKGLNSDCHLPGVDSRTGRGGKLEIAQ